MKFRLTTHVRKAYVTILGSALFLVAFQNCGKAGFDSGLDEGLSQSSTDAELAEQFGKSDAEKVAAAPFAFDTIVDQIAYNSCSGASVPNTPAFFTFKLGGYTEAGGVKLRQTFLEYVADNFKPVYPATELSDLQIKNILAASPENKSARPQFAIRTRNRPQQIRSSNSAVNEGIDFFDLLGDLTNDRFMDPLVKSRQNAVAYFPFAVNSDERIVEARIAYNSSEGLAQNLRTDFNQYAQLSMTYTARGESDPYIARFPADSLDANKAYGRGYNLTFSADEAPFTRTADLTGRQIKPNNPNNILTGVTETNLEKTSAGSGATWLCDPMRRYVVMKTTDAGACPKDPAIWLTSGMPATTSSPALSAKNYARELAIVRRSLRSEDWHVSVAYRCAIPKVSGVSCYLNETLNGAMVGIQYDQTLECFQGVANQDYSNPALPPTKRCAQYVSICTRN